MELGGKVGIGRFVVALECMNWLLESSTGMDGLVDDMGWVGSVELVLSMKWPVAPVSAIISVCGADIESPNK